jgi:EmrB/QacA subfamily drug resistance transporter
MPTPDPRRWWLLAVVAAAQLVILLDVSIVTIALPSAQADLGISDADRHWVVTAYGITFGGLLLLGGRLGDYLGRRRVFIGSLVGFGVASAIGGIAGSAEVLFAARALQGAFAAAMAPAILALLTVAFTDPGERAKAFGVWAGASGIGGTLGLILGGFLTEYLSWRWTLLVNTPIVLALAIAGFRFITESRIHGEARYDLPGVVTSTVGVASMVYGATQAEGHGWTSVNALGPMIAGVLLIALFVLIEHRSAQPLLPLSVLTDRVRAGSFGVNALLASAMFANNVLVIYYLQTGLGYSAVESGLAFLPLTVTVVASATVGARLLPRVGARPLAVVGSLFGVAGFGILATIGPNTDYLTVLVPGLVLCGLCTGVAWPVVSGTAMVGVSERDAGAAGGMVNVAQQVTGAVVVAVLNTVAASIASDGGPTSLIDGYATGLAACAGLMVVATVVAATTLRVAREDLPAEVVAPA